MPKFGFTIGTLLLTLALGACAVRESARVEPPSAAITTIDIATEWIAFAIDGVDEVLNPKPRLRWLNTEQVSGTGGCNAFTGSASLGQDRLHIGPLSPTGAPCLALPGAQEDLFFKALELTRKARIERDQLVLMDAAGRVLARFRKAD